MILSRESTIPKGYSACKTSQIGDVAADKPPRPLRITATMEVGQIGRRPDIQFAVLEQLAACGCVSRRTFDMLPFSYTNISVNLKKLTSGGTIKLMGVGNKKYYTLLPAGKQMLMDNNPQRYSPDKFHDQAVIARHPERSRASGDVAAMLAAAGFSVHSDDKPALPAHTPVPTPNDRDPYRTRCRNQADMAYEHPGNTATYHHRNTPINCYYDSIEVKQHFKEKNDNGLRYSRATGLLMTTRSLLRVYNTRDVAMEFHPTGEKKLETIMPRAFGGYCPDQTGAALVFGDSRMKSAEKIIANSSGKYRQVIRWRRQKEQQKGKLLDYTNLAAPLYYVPMMKEMLPILKLLLWPDEYRFAVDQYAILLFEEDGTYQLHDKGIFYAEANGLYYFMAYTLNLTNLRRLMTLLEKKEVGKVAVVCSEWQRDYLEEIVVANISSDDAYERIQWKSIPDDFFTDMWAQ